MSDCPSQVETPEGLREIAGFLMEDRARDFSRDNLRHYLEEERPDLTECQLRRAITSLRDLIGDADVAISWPAADSLDPGKLLVDGEEAEQHASTVSVAPGTWTDIPGTGIKVRHEEEGIVNVTVRGGVLTFDRDVRVQFAQFSRGLTDIPVPRWLEDE